MHTSWVRFNLGYVSCGLLLAWQNVLFLCPDLLEALVPLLLGLYGTLPTLFTQVLAFHSSRFMLEASSLSEADSKKESTCWAHVVVMNSRVK